MNQSSRLENKQKANVMNIMRIAKKTTDEGWNVTLYIDFLYEADKYTLVWREWGNPDSS